MNHIECRYCRWWTLPAEATRNLLKDTEQAPCMFNPPVATLIPSRDALGQPSLQNVTFWPTPAANSRCHNFEPVSQA